MEVSPATPDEVNAAANHPRVRPAVAGDFDHVDLAPFFQASVLNVALRVGDAIMLFAHYDDGCYDAHYLAPREEVKGAELVKAFSAMLDVMFTEYGATAITGAISRDNRAARLMSARLGFKQVGRCFDTLERECSIYKLRRESWAV